MTTQNHLTKSGIDKPFRVSYYKPSSIEDGRALLHSIVVIAANAADAKDIVQEISDRVAVKAYPFYRNLGTPTRKTWHIVSGPDSAATKAVMKDLAGTTAHDQHEQLMDTFTKKSRFDSYGDQGTARDFIGIPAGARVHELRLPNIAKAQALDPTNCKWHGNKYMVNGRCTKLDPAPQPSFNELAKNQLRQGTWKPETKYEAGQEIASSGTVESSGASVTFKGGTLYVAPLPAQAFTTNAGPAVEIESVKLTFNGTAAADGPYECGPECKICYPDSVPTGQSKDEPVTDPVPAVRKDFVGVVMEAITKAREQGSNVTFDFEDREMEARPDGTYSTLRTKPVPPLAPSTTVEKCSDSNCEI